VHGAREELLAGAALAEDEDGGRLRAAMRASSSVASIAGDFVTRSWNWYSLFSAFRRITFSRTRACCATIFSTMRLTSSGSNGLTM